MLQEGELDVPRAVVIPTLALDFDTCRRSWRMLIELKGSIPGLVVYKDSDESLFGNWCGTNVNGLWDVARPFTP